MQQRISLITLGCRDMPRAAAFYAAMGWRQVDVPDEGIVVFDLIGQALGLYPLETLAEDMGRRPEELGHGAATLSHNVSSREEVDALTRRAETAGSTVLRAPSDVFWGGYIAYIADPEGHVWEFAFNPFAKLGPDGAFCWGGYD